MKDSLVVRSDGRVELDGKEIGWVHSMQLVPVYKFTAAIVNGREEYEIRFDIHVVPEKPEPDAVHDLAGRIIGYLKADGTVEPITPGAAPGQRAS